MRRSSTLLVALLVGSLAGCAPAPTQLVVVVDTDIPIPGQLDEVIVQGTGPSGVMERESATLGDRTALPLTVGVSPSGDALGPIEVVALGRLGGALVVTRTHRVELVRGETRMLAMHLSRACVETSCPAERTCSEQGCVPVAVGPDDLLGWTGTPPRLAGDGGVADGGVDGAVPCGSAADCDDANPCTDDACTPEGCRNTGNDDGCDDGSFCNGLDRCADGACVGAGDPCTGPTSCDETRDVCTGCASDADCPGRSEGAWGACDFGGSSCGESGTATRTVVTFSCESGACVPHETAETQACARETDGELCASRSCAEFGACEGWSSACDTTGTRTRACSRGICSSGTCTTETTSETEDCSRATDGSECAADTCEAYGPCSFPSACATVGTQTRTCTGPATCSGGSCGSGATRTETGSCSRPSPDGASCGPGTCGAWGACTGFECELTGTQTRSCTPEVCSAGACVLGAAVSDTQACTRDVTGVACDDGDECTNLDRCTVGGLCRGRFCSVCCELEPL